MILDKILLKNLKDVSDAFCENNSVNPPTNYETLAIYFKKLKEKIMENDVHANFIAMVFYSFVSSKEVRDRGTTARTMEDIFGYLIGVEATDKAERSNPLPSKKIIKYDNQNNTKDFTISQDLASNKREKADHRIGNYYISMKTLKGKLYDKNNNVVDKEHNSEINIGSFSYRALFWGLTNKKLGDRKNGLGSKKQIKELLEDIESLGNFNELKKRIIDFMEYVYEEDFIIIFKSGYVFDVYLIPNASFRTTISKTLNENKPIEEFTKIWNRWENNNLRIDFDNLKKKMDEYEISYDHIDLNLSNFEDVKELNETINSMENYISKKIEDLI